VRLGGDEVSRLADEAHPGVIEPLVAPGLPLIIAIGRTIQVSKGHLHGNVLLSSRFADLINGDTPTKADGL
jgi:hypothetical protein